MNLGDFQLQFFNVIVVYESIDLMSVSRDRARNVGPASEQPILTDIPGEILLVAYQHSRLTCQYDRRRLIVQAVKPDSALVGADTLPYMLRGAMEAITSSRAVNAYGFNYSITTRLEEPTSVGAFLRDRFLAHGDETANSLQGTVAGIEIQLQYECPPLGSTNRLHLVQDDAPQALRGTLNVHRDSADVPAVQDLQNLLNDGYTYFERVLRSL